MRGANIENTDFGEAKMSGVDLREAFISVTSFAGADLRGADLTGLRLPEVNFTGANLSDASLVGIRAVEGTNLVGARYANADLRFSSIRDMPGLDLNGFDLVGARFAGDMTGASFRDTNMPGVSFVGSEAVFNAVAFDGANLRHATFGRLFNDVGFVGTDLFGASFQSEVRNADFSRAILVYVGFLNSDLTGARFAGANLFGTRWAPGICPDGTEVPPLGSCLDHLID